MLLGSFPYGTCYFVMWFVPSSNQAVLFVYYLAIKCLADLAFTSINVSQIALLNDLSDDYEERFKVNILRFTCTGLGSLVGVVLSGVLSKLIPEETTKFVVQAMIISVVMVFAILVCVWQTRAYSKFEHATTSKQQATSILQSLKSVFGVRPAVLAIGIYVCSVVALQSTLVMVPYFLEDYLLLDDFDVVVIVLVAQLSGFSVAGILLVLAKRVEKRYVFFVGAGIWMMFYILVPIILGPDKPIYPIYLLAGLLGCGLATAMIIPISMVTDAGDYVHLQTGRKQEGMLFGIMHMLNKILLGIIIFVYEYALSAAQFSPGSSEPLKSSAQRTIQLGMTVIPLFMLIAGLVCNYFVPITKRNMAKVGKLLRGETLDGEEGVPLVYVAPKTNGGSPPYLTVFLIDGADHEVFQDLLKAGELPNIGRLVAQGSYIENGITSLPSMTGYAFYPLITGYDAANSGILGLRWFNRDSERISPGMRNYVGRTNVHMNKDTYSSPKTVYEYFGDEHSYTSQTYMNRGAKVQHFEGWSFSTAKYSHLSLFKVLTSIPFVKSYDWYQYEDRIANDAIADLENRPKVQWITLASGDAYHHVNGSDAEYAKILRHLDHCIGRYVQKSVELGQEPDRIYCVCSDHGVVNVRHNMNLGATLNELCDNTIRYTYGKGTYIFSDKLPDSFENYEQYNLVIAINGNVSAWLYFKSPSNDWSRPLTYQELLAYPLPNGRRVNLIRTVVNMQGIEHVLTKGEQDQTAEICGANGTAVIYSDGKNFRYSIKEGKDPLHYPSELHDAVLSKEEWMHATVHTDYPLAPVRVWTLMVNNKATVGDIMVCTNADYDLGKDFELFVHNYRGGHGGLRKDQMLVPYVLKGPGIAQNRINTALVEDVGATLLHLMGMDMEQADGRILTELLDQER